MTAAVTLTEDDLMEAVRHFLAAKGWHATRVEIDVGWEDPWPVFATADVEIPAPKAAPEPPDDEPDPTPPAGHAWYPRRAWDPRFPPYLQVVA